MKLFHNLYAWVLAQAKTRHARRSLALVAFTESWIFPIPPDVMLLPMCLGHPERAYRLAWECVGFSLLGALLGYAIGSLLWDSLGQWVITTYHLEHAMQQFRAGFQEWGAAIILAKGLTPIPFKLVTIASGIAHMSLLPFVLACFATRATRFLLVAWLAVHYGPRIQPFIEKYLTWLLLAVLLVLVVGVWLVL